MSNYPDGVRPGDEDPPRRCGRCGDVLGPYDEGIEINGELLCRFCGNEALLREQMDEEVSRSDVACAICGIPVDSTNASWDEVLGAYVCNECEDLPEELRPK